MTRRERLEKRAEKRREWADSAAKKADAAHERVHQIADGIPFGQPILVGHHSERRARKDQERMHSGMRTSVDESRKAERHEQVADSIERQLATTIFSDDEDAVEALRAKAARLEEERDRMKQANADFKRAHKAELAAMTPYERSQAVPYPSYSLSNLGARIRDAKKRADQVEREQALRDAGVRAGGRVMLSRYPGECGECGGGIERGESIIWYRTTREALHAECDQPLDGALVVSYGNLSESELEGLADGSDRQERRAARRELAHREARQALFAEEEADA
jgi:uncharacterized protein DUF3560